MFVVVSVVFVCLAFLVNVHGSYFEPKASVRNGVSVNYLCSYALTVMMSRIRRYHELISSLTIQLFHINCPCNQSELKCFLRNSLNAIPSITTRVVFILRPLSGSLSCFWFNLSLLIALIDSIQFVDTISKALEIPKWRIFNIRKEEARVDQCLKVKFGIIGKGTPILLLLSII